MANADETLQAFINKMLQLQNEQREKPLSQAELKQIALDIGMSEEEWEASQKIFEGHLTSGLGHLQLRNWSDAIKELDQAYALNPNSLEACRGLAQAYQGQWMSNPNQTLKSQAEKYAEMALRMKPGDRASLEVLKQLRQGEQAQKSGKTRRALIGFGVAAVLIIIGAGSWFASQSAEVDKAVLVEQKWAQVENVYQRRADLIPRLVQTVKARANFEKSTLEQLNQAYQNAQAVQVDAKSLNPRTMANFQKSQQDLSEALIKLQSKISLDEDLSTSQAYRDLQVQIEGSENRIAVERKRYNEAVAAYNVFIQKFPYTIFGYQKKAYFKADKKALTA
ncbi:MAG: LemA family protein, partial [Bacteroidota bacterium]